MTDQPKNGTGMHPTNIKNDNTTKFDFSSRLFMKGEAVKSIEYGAGIIKFVQEKNGIEEAVVSFDDATGKKKVKKIYKTTELVKKNKINIILSETLLEACDLNVDEIKELITHGADVNAKDKNNLSVLYLLGWRGVPGSGKDKEIAEKTEILIKAGAKVDFKDMDGNGILEVATSPEFVSTILKTGIVIDDRYTEKLIRKWKEKIDLFRNTEWKYRHCNYDEIIKGLKKQIEIIEKRNMRRKKRGKNERS